jgi:hypothetical protein
MANYHNFATHKQQYNVIYDVLSTHHQHNNLTCFSRVQHGHMFRPPSDDHLQDIKAHKLKLQLKNYFYVGKLKSHSLGATIYTSI